jgi:hypothetical protein
VTGQWVAEAAGVLDLSVWPKGVRVIVRKERPHPRRHILNSAIRAVDAVPCP